MGDEEKLKIIIEAQNKAKAAFDEAQKQIDDTEKKFGSAIDRMNAAGDKMKAVGAKMTKFVTLPILAGAGLSVKAFSDLQETMNKVDVSFGDSSNAVKDWSKSSIKSMGLAQQSALDAAALFGDMGTGMGQTQADASKMSMALTQLGADMASFKNVSFERAQTALAGIYTGETEALKSLGIVMTETNLEQFRMEQGITKTLDEMTQAEKVQLRYNFVMAKTANAQGDFVRTSDSIANKQRVAQEKTKQLSAELGGKLAPMYQKLLEVGTKVLDWFGKLTPTQQKWIVYIGLAVAALGPLLSLIGSLMTAFTLFASPVFLVVAAIAALVAGLVYAYFKFDGFRKFVDKVWRNVVKVSLWAWENVIKPIWEAIVWYVTNLLIPGWKKIFEVAKVIWEKIVTVVSWAWNNIIKPLWDIIWAYITNVLIPVWTKIFEAAKVVWDAIVTVIKWAWENVIKPLWDAVWAYITTVLVPVWQKIWDIAVLVWNGIVTAVQAAWDFIKPIWDKVWAYVQDTLIPTFQKIWDKVKEVFTNVWDKISTTWNNVKAGFDKVKGWVQTLIDTFSTIKDNISTAMGNVADAIKSPFKTAFNGIAKLWNSTVGKLSFTIPDWVPGLGGKKFEVPDIPTFYKGVRNFGGGPAIVGDIRGRGGEIVNLPSGSDVFSNRESKRILRGLADGNVPEQPSQNIFTGNIILNDRSAVEEFFARLDRQGELSSMGMPV